MCYSSAGCTHIETIFRPHDDNDAARFAFDYNDVHAVMKVLHVCEHFLVTYECFDAETIEGYCPIDHEEVR